MHEHADQSPEKSTIAVAQRLIQQKGGGSSAYLEDNRPVANRLAALQGMAESSPRVKHFKPFQQAAIQKKENTGLPETLKMGVENLSGHSMNDVKVHYNSGEPAKLQALAYARGTAIHLAPGQEKHLPHEAWHVVQQKQGRVRPTTQAKGAAINDDAGMEKEADVMGGKALRAGKAVPHDSDKKSPLQMKAGPHGTAAVAQRVVVWRDPQKTYVKDLVNTVLSFTDFGVTPVILNTVEIPGGDAAAAIYGPRLGLKPATRFALIKGYELSILDTPVNLVGYRVELPTNPPWTRQVSFEHAKSAIGMLQANVTGDPFPADESIMITLQVRGLPDDGTFAQLVDQHENHHVNEIGEIIGRILTPWDARIAAFSDQQKTIFGLSEEGATEKFYTQMGGTPAEIGKEIESDLKASGDLFHTTHEGGSPTIALATYRAANATIDVFFRHPGDLG